jgi:hypothetical protein
VAAASQIVRGAILGSSMKSARQNDNPTVNKSGSQAESVSGKLTRRSVNITKMHSKRLDRMESALLGITISRFKHQGLTERRSDT